MDRAVPVPNLSAETLGRGCKTGPSSQAQRHANFLRKARKRCLTGMGHLPINRLHEVTTTGSSERVSPSGKELRMACLHLLFVA